MPSRIRASTTGDLLCRVIQLQSLLPIQNPGISHEVFGFAEGTDTIFLKTDVAVFALDINSRKTKKVVFGLALDLTHTRGHRNSGEGDNTHKDLPATNATEHELLYLGFY
jgi:hypothetical protein